MLSLLFLLGNSYYSCEIVSLHAFVISVMAQGSFLLPLWPAIADKRLGPAPSPGIRPHGDTDPVLCKCPVLNVFICTHTLDSLSTVVL